MNKINAGVIVKTKFVDKFSEIQKNSKQNKKIKTFKSYIDYMDRVEAIRNDNFNQFSLYNDYMANSKKTFGMFTSNNDRLTDEQKQEYKKVFKKAYDNNSIMWQTVISFDNRFLTKNNIFDPATGYLDEKKIQKCTRKMMEEMLKLENMVDSGVWTASIHYNTDNIHVHIATVEPNSTRKKIIIDRQERPRGFFKPKTFSAMKSKVVNQILERDRSIMDDLLKKRLVGAKKEKCSFDNEKLKEMFIKTYDDLPRDGTVWFYNNMDDKTKRKIDKMTKEYINEYFKDEFAQFHKQIINEKKIFEEAYGYKSKANKYAENKIDDLYERFGNAILKEMRDFSKVDMMKNKFCPRENKIKTNNGFYLNKLKFLMGKKLKQDYLNKKSYDNVLNGWEELN